MKSSALERDTFIARFNHKRAWIDLKIFGDKQRESTRVTAFKAYAVRVTETGKSRYCTGIKADPPRVLHSRCKLKELFEQWASVSKEPFVCIPPNWLVVQKY